jgi:hypothetical protein
VSAGPGRHPSGRTLLLFGLVLLGFVGVGRLALEAWMVRPAPRHLPEIGARRTKAAPYLFVVLDGLREAAAWLDQPGSMPWLRSFAKRGAWGIAIAGEPTLTAPCVRTLLTGRRPDLLTAFRNFNARPVQGSVIGYLHERGAITAHGGDAAAFQFCRPAYDDPARVLQFPDQGPTDQGACDARAVPHVLKQIATGATCISMHLTAPDHAGHKWGAVGPQYAAACAQVDGQVHRVVDAFLARHPDGTVLISADHGVSAMGTHGGGEATAKRAPFVLVGPGIARVHVPSLKPGARVDQCSLAPTVCAALGLPQPPLADAPPDLRLLDLPADVERGALQAYVQARVAVARELLGDRAADAVVRDERHESLDAQVAEVNRLLLPNSTGHATGALLLAALWLVVLVGLVSMPSTRPGRALWIAAVACGALFLLSFDLTAPRLTISAPLAGGLVVLGCVLALRASGLRRPAGAAVTLACLATMPVLTGSGFTLQETFTRGLGGGGADERAGLALLGAAVLMGVFLRPRRLLADLAARARAAPGLVVAFGGVLVGFTLTLRPFIDPYVHVMILYAIAGCAVVAWMLHSEGARARPRWERVVLAAVGLVMFVGTRVAEGFAGQVWVNATAMHDVGWLLIGIGFVAVLGGFVLQRVSLRRDAVGLGLSALALAMAYVVRADRQAFWGLAVATADALPFLHPAYVAMAIRDGPALLALSWSLGRGSPDGRLAARLLAGVALAREFAVFDAEFAVFALAGIGAALAARMILPRRRIALAWLAVGVLALRTAIFHAMGFEETFSTLDVGQAFAGLEATKTAPLDAAGGAVITGQIIVASIQMALRMALPWVLIVAALTRAAERTRQATLGAVRCVLGDVAVAFAARGAAIAVALWAWWRNSWWMTHAYTVYAYAAADVILLLVCAVLCGAFRRPAEELPPPAPVPA